MVRQIMSFLYFWKQKLMKEVTQSLSHCCIRPMHQKNIPNWHPKVRFIITWRFFSLESSFRLRVERRKERSWMVAARGKLCVAWGNRSKGTGRVVGGRRRRIPHWWKKLQNCPDTKKSTLLSCGASLAWRARSDSGSKDGKKGLGWWQRGTGRVVGGRRRRIPHW